MAEYDPSAPLPPEDAYMRLEAGEYVDPVELAEQFIVKPDDYRMAMYEMQDVGELIAADLSRGVRTTETEDNIAKRDFLTEALSGAQAILDPEMPDPMPAYEEPLPGTPEGRQADAEANHAYHELSAHLNKLMLQVKGETPPEEFSGPDDDKPTKYEEWEQSVNKSLNDIDDILGVYPNFSPHVRQMIIENGGHVSTHGSRTRVVEGASTVVDGNVVEAQKKADQLRIAAEMFDPYDTSVAADGARKAMYAARHQANEARRHASVDEAHYGKFLEVIGFDEETGAPTNLRNYDVYADEYHNGMESGDIYATEAADMERQTAEERQNMLLGLEHFNQSRDPRGETELVAASAAMQEHLRDLDGQLRELSPHHSRYDVVRGARDELVRSIIQARFIKERIRNEVAPRARRDRATGNFLDASGNPLPKLAGNITHADVYGRPIAPYTPDKGFKIADTIIFEDGSYQRTSIDPDTHREVRSVRRTASGHTWIQPPAFQELPEVNRPEARPIPRGFSEHLTDAVVDIATARSWRDTTRRGRIARGERIEDGRDIDQLQIDLTRLIDRGSFQPGDRDTAAEMRLTAHILRQRLEEKTDIAEVRAALTGDEIDALPDAEWYALRRARTNQQQINMLNYRLHYIEAGTTGSGDIMAANGSVVADEFMNGIGGRWTIRPDGSATLWSPAVGPLGRPTKIADYAPEGVRI